MTMKENENQNAAFYDSRSFGRETDPLMFGRKEIYELDDSRITIDPLAFETEVRDENRKGIDDISIDNRSGTVDCPRKDDQNGLSDHVSGWKKDSDTLLSSDMYGKDKKQISPEHESWVTVEEFTLCSGNEYRDSSSQRDDASDLFETVTNVFTDKNVLECELPELDVMKDICVDNGMCENDKILLESFKDDKSCHVFPQNSYDNNHCEANQREFKEDNNHCEANQCEIKEDDNGKLVDQEKCKTYSVSSSEKDTAKQCDPLELVQIGEANCEATNSSDKDSLVDKKLPIQEHGTQRIFDSLDGEGNRFMQPANQIPIEKAVSEEDVQASRLTYNSKVESGIITFNFSDTDQVQCTSSSIGSIHEQSLIVEDKNPDSSSANSKIQPVSSKTSNVENVREQQKDDNSDDFSSDGQVQSPSDKSQCSTNDDAPAAGQGQYDQGETSFSAVTYSGPVAFSGSLSHRSDASTTSARSFAFPVLQSEWNSSPVRMAKADRRHYRKQKGWRSGILCCRF